MYAPLQFPIPTPVPHMRLGAVPADYMIFRPSPILSTVSTVKPLPPIRISPPVQAAAPTSGPEATFVEVGPNEWLNLNTGQIVDAETMQNVANAATTNPSILTATVDSLPPGVVSQPVTQQVQAGTLPTAQSTGLTSGGAPSWWTETQTLFGYQIPNWGLLAGGLGVAFLLFGGSRRGRR